MSEVLGGYPVGSSLADSPPLRLARPPFLSARSVDAAHLFSRPFLLLAESGKRSPSTFIQNALILLPLQPLQVEKRLASEKEPTSFAASPSSISFGSPLYIPEPQSASFKPSAVDESSGPASGFLSIPPPIVHDPDPPLAAQDDFNDEEEDDDQIDRLISLLGLSADGDDDGGGLGSCHCSGGRFYRRTVGLKGPICEKEMQRLDGWIEHYLQERKESARLAHLLLAKAVSLAASGGGNDDDDDAFGGIGYPPTVEEFLEHDPPFDKG